MDTDRHATCKPNLRLTAGSPSRWPASVAPVSGGRSCAEPGHVEGLCTCRNSRRGQAMIELTIGMLVLIVLAAVIYQLTTFVRAGHETAVRAREQAGALALQDYPLSVTADYIAGIEMGPDGKPYTRDDQFEEADPSRYNSTILEPLAGDPADWNTLDAIPGNAFSELHASSSPIAIFGLLRGEDSEDVDLLPAVQHLLYNAESIQIEETVWMPWTKGVY